MSNRTINRPKNWSKWYNYSHIHCIHKTALRLYQLIEDRTPDCTVNNLESWYQGSNYISHNCLQNNFGTFLKNQYSIHCCTVYTKFFLNRTCNFKFCTVYNCRFEGYSFERIVGIEELSWGWCCPLLSRCCTGRDRGYSRRCWC